MAVRATQLLVVIFVVAAVLMSTAADEIDTDGGASGARRSLYIQQQPVYTWSPPPRAASCKTNATLCLDPTMHPAGPTCCASKCVDTKYDAWNCGGCSRACYSGWICCNSKCVNPLTDSSNCGSCGHACAKNKKGKMGICTSGICGYNGYGW